MRRIEVRMVATRQANVSMENLKSERLAVNSLRARSTLASPLQKSQVVENAANRFRVSQRSALDHPFRLRNGEDFRRDLLVFFRMGFAVRESFRGENPHPFIHKAGCRN